MSKVDWQANPVFPKGGLDVAWPANAIPKRFAEGELAEFAPLHLNKSASKPIEQEAQAFRVRNRSARLSGVSLPNNVALA